MVANRCPRCGYATHVEDIYIMCARLECSWSTMMTKEERENMSAIEKLNARTIEERVSGAIPGDEVHTYDMESVLHSTKVATHDPVNNPAHYTQGGIECIDALKAALTPEEFIGFLKGNTIKYLWRMNRKTSPSEDSAKAQWYLNKLNEELKNG
jgi:hypothetical protein